MKRLFIALGLLFTSTTIAAAYCGPCTTPRKPVKRDLVCVTACMSPQQWADCKTKSWWADSKDHRDRTPRFFSRCGTVCRPAGSPNLGYFGPKESRHAGWVVFRFTPVR